MTTTKRNSNVPNGSHASVLPEAPPILPPGFAVGGWLEQLEAVGDGLVRVVVSGREYLVDDSLQEKLSTLMGQHMTIVRAFGQWGCGALA